MITPEEILKNAVDQGKIAGSWLITGPVGVGKKTLVRRLIRYVIHHDFSQEMSDFHPQVKWLERSLTDEAKKEIQKTILAGKSVDKDQSFSRKKVISVDDIRDALSFLSLKSTQGQYKILVISPADDMNDSAANALLKMLEEPSSDSIILLLSDNVGKLLPTIKSRCKILQVKPKSEQDVARILETLRPDCPHTALVAELAEGSVGLGLQIIDRDGLTMFQKIQSFDVPVREMDQQALETFSDQIAKEDQSFLLFKTLLLNDWAAKAKKTLYEGSGIGFIYADLYQQAKELFQETDGLNLDRKQAIKTIFFKLAAAKG